MSSDSGVATRHEHIPRVSPGSQQLSISRPPGLCFVLCPPCASLTHGLPGSPRVTVTPTTNVRSHHLVDTQEIRDDIKNITLNASRRRVRGLGLRA
jgi:hypothetical protein